MPAIALRSFAKINLGLRIGSSRSDGFHELHTVYQTVALHDVVRLEITRGSGIELRCRAEGVPLDESNTCYRMAERVLRCAKTRERVRIDIDKKLPVQGGLGAASSNAAAVLIGLERLLKIQIAAERKLELAAEVGSDVPLFLIGGMVLGLGRGEQVYALEDLPRTNCIIATPRVRVSTPQAFADWDRSQAKSRFSELTAAGQEDRIKEFSRAVFSAFGHSYGTSSGVSGKARNRAEPLLLDLVRAGIENDFERVVFPQHPELREVKRVLEREGAALASLSGSGSSLYGLFAAKTAAVKAARALERLGTRAEATTTLMRREFWKKVVIG